MALTAAQVNRILALRGELFPGIPDKVPDPTELRLALDRVLRAPAGNREMTARWQRNRDRRGPTTTNDSGTVCAVQSNRDQEQPTIASLASSSRSIRRADSSKSHLVPQDAYVTSMPASVHC